jgi:hypothetical protein
MSDTELLQYMWDNGLYVHRYESGWVCRKGNGLGDWAIKGFASDPRTAIENTARGVEVDLTVIPKPDTD